MSGYRAIRFPAEQLAYYRSTIPQGIETLEVHYPDGTVELRIFHDQKMYYEGQRRKAERMALRQLIDRINGNR